MWRTSIGMSNSLWEVGMVRISRRGFTVSAAVLAGTGMVGGLSPGAIAQDASPSAASGYSAVPSADGGEFTVTHAQGETTVTANPSRVVVFDIASLDTLDTLGVEVLGVAQGSVTGHLEKYNSDPYINAGTLFEPDYEAVFAAEPDLIIVAGRSSAVYPDLADIAPTIDLTVAQDSDHIEGLTINATLLGELFGKQEEVATALDAIYDRVAGIQEVASTSGNGLVIMTTGGEVTVLAATGARGGRGGLIYNTLGVQPAIEDIEEATHGEAVSFEFLLEANPDWLFVIDRDVATGGEGDAAEQILDNEIVHETTAWQQEQIVYLDPFSWYIAMNGLTVTNLMLDDIAAGYGIS